MLKLKQALAAASGAVLLTLFASASAHAQKAAATPAPAPPPLWNVTVVNTPSEPLPIAGTVTGTVDITNTLEVNVANTPTVRIDPSTSVPVAPAGTRKVFDSELVSFVDDNNGPLTFGPIDISKYSKIRLCVSHLGPTDIKVTVASMYEAATRPMIENSLFLDEFSVEDNVGSVARNGPTVTRLYETAGRHLFLNIYAGDTELHKVRVVVFGS
jgi:hypothetical protein